MTKAELIEDVSRVVEMSRKDSEIIVETIFDSIVKSLKAGDKIEIRGFGSFRTRQRKPRIGRNPKTGARVDVPAKKIPYFKPSKELKDLVNTSPSTESSCGSTSCPARGPEPGDSLGVRVPPHGALRKLWITCGVPGDIDTSARQARVRVARSARRWRWTLRTTANTWCCIAGESNFILLNLYPYTTGHVLVTPYAHVANLDQVTPETLVEMMELGATAPDGIASML